VESNFPVWGGLLHFLAASEVVVCRLILATLSRRLCELVCFLMSSSVTMRCFCSALFLSCAGHVASSFHLTTSALGHFSRSLRRRLILLCFVSSLLTQLQLFRCWISWT
jgi:hypothetical protein